MCYPVCGMMHIKDPLLLIRNNSERISHVIVAVDFLSRFLNGPLPYDQPYITVNKVFIASLNKTFPSFLLYTLYNKKFISHIIHPFHKNSYHTESGLLINRLDR